MMHLFKFMFLRLSYGNKSIDWSQISAEEKALAEECVFDGAYWPSLVIEEARKAGHPFSDYIEKHVSKI